MYTASVGGLANGYGVFAVYPVYAIIAGGFWYAWREAKKVVWPSRKEAVQMTGYVFAFAVVMALFLWFTDKTLEWVLYDLILGWKR